MPHHYCDDCKQQYDMFPAIHERDEELNQDVYCFHEYKKLTKQLLKEKKRAKTSPINYQLKNK
jgi:hypothetical protein